jgi:hypothetical protein
MFLLPQARIRLTICSGNPEPTAGDRPQIMIHLHKALHAWGTPDFKATLQLEIAQLGADHLPLQQGLTSGNYVVPAPITVMINNVAETGNIIRIKAGIFYQGVMGGCSCADDPAPASESSEYCEVLLGIDRITAATTVELVE